MEEGKQMIYKRLEFNVHGDDRGSLIALEQFQSIPLQLNEFIIFMEQKIM